MICKSLNSIRFIQRPIFFGIGAVRIAQLLTAKHNKHPVEYKQNQKIPPGELNSFCEFETKDIFQEYNGAINN